jgi:hypothetical protein
MKHHVHVQTLPPGLSFPPDLERKVCFDQDRKQLCFEGFMSKATFDRLYRLAEDRDYRRAVEQLFQLSTFDDPVAEPASPKRSLWSQLFRVRPRGGGR